jgi:tetraacyldisaccharide 4'-kinase
LIIKKLEETERENKIIITTEKDSVRLTDMPGLPDELKEALYYLPVRVKFLNETEKLFDKKMLNYVGENKSNRKLYKKKV